MISSNRYFLETLTTKRVLALRIPTRRNGRYNNLVFLQAPYHENSNIYRRYLSIWNEKINLNNKKINRNDSRSSSSNRDAALARKLNDLLDPEKNKNLTESERLSREQYIEALQKYLSSSSSEKISDKTISLQEEESTKISSKQLRVQNRTRKDVMFSLGVLLKNDNECFKKTMNYLFYKEFPKDGNDDGTINSHAIYSQYFSDANDENNEDRIFLEDFKKIYKESINELLVSANLNENIVNNFDLILEDCTEIGLADLNKSKKYRKMKHHQRNIDFMQEKLRKCKIEVDNRQKVVDSLKEELVIARNNTQDMYKFDLNHLKTINKKLHNMKLLLDMTNESYLDLLSSYTMLSNEKTPLSKEEYERMSNVVNDILYNKLCPVVANKMYQYEEFNTLIQTFKKLNEKSDLTQPQNWYMYARLQKRKIVFHGGPTNSGKTYEALERLKQSNNGLYLGPLRLLASEIYETLSKQGFRTNLFTGQEKRSTPNSTHTAATIEMTRTNIEYDVAIIDEVQMLGDVYRGYAWTRAFLGIRCKELHVCGGFEALPIIEKLAKACGDTLEVKTYQRFGELTLQNQSLAIESNEIGCYCRVQPGDCIVAFSQNDIFAIRREIESTTPYKCCIIYGSLPPETRTDQAKLFNDADSGFDILVASDAIGMGLNLNIKRVIFNSVYKNDGERITLLSPSSVKQIAGRAGRRNSPYPNGFVTCRNPDDLCYLRQCLEIPNEPVTKAGIVPMAQHIEHFSKELSPSTSSDENENVSIHQILTKFSKMATLTGEDYFLCKQNDMLEIAKLIDQIPLSLKEKFTFCMCPVNPRDGKPKTALKNYAWKHYIGQSTGLLENGQKEPYPPESYFHLSKLCTMYSEVDVYLWLCLRFPNATMVDEQELHAAQLRKKKLVELIDGGIANNKDWELNHCYLERDTRLRKKEKETRESQ